MSLTPSATGPVYSTRSCRRCGTAMSAIDDPSSRRRWRCDSCGRSER